MKVINLISGPRNLSTALMYAFAQRTDCKVIDEPYYAYYLKNADVKISHPATKRILDTMESSESKITNAINTMSQKTNVFVKGMAHHYLSSKPHYILNWENVILIRHPKKLITSFSKVISNPSIEDIGIKKASELFIFLKNNNKKPIVIDSDELLLNPKEYLNLLCDKIGVSFQETMLSWPKGGIPEDGVWAEYWYKNVHNSTGFLVQKTSNDTMPARFQKLLEEALQYYEVLRQEILKN